ncbi:hypothetical protein ACS86_16345 [Vibrio alginolyticus]|nr:hypothetical protein ACS86_16345 [Vibrio alginolyticus]
MKNQMIKLKTLVIILFVTFFLRSIIMNVLSALFKTCSGSTGSGSTGNVSKKDLREVNNVKDVGQRINSEKSRKLEKFRAIKDLFSCGSNKKKAKLTQKVKYNKLSEKAKTQGINNNQRTSESKKLDSEKAKTQDTNNNQRTSESKKLDSEKAKTRDINNNQRKSESTKLDSEKAKTQDIDNNQRKSESTKTKLDEKSEALRAKAKAYTLWFKGHEDYKNEAPGLAYSSQQFFDLEDKIANQRSEIKSLDKTILSTERNIAQLQGKEDPKSKVALDNSKVGLVALKAERARQQHKLRGTENSYKAINNNVNFYATSDLIDEVENLLSIRNLGLLGLSDSEKEKLNKALASLKVLREKLRVQYKEQFSHN